MSISPFGPVGCGRPLRGQRDVFTSWCIHIIQWCIHIMQWCIHINHGVFTSITLAHHTVVYSHQSWCIHIIQWCIHIIQWCIHINHTRPSYSGVITSWCIHIIQWCIHIIQWCIHMIQWCIHIIQWCIHIIQWCIHIIQWCIHINHTRPSSYSGVFASITLAHHTVVYSHQSHSPIILWCIHINHTRPSYSGVFTSWCIHINHTRPSYSGVFTSITLAHHTVVYSHQSHSPIIQWCFLAIHFDKVE
jgi:hypothetical protein